MESFYFWVLNDFLNPLIFTNFAKYFFKDEVGFPLTF